MKALTLLIIALIPIFGYSQPVRNHKVNSYRSIKISTVSELKTARIQKTAGTIFQIIGAAAIGYTTIKVHQEWREHYRDPRKPSQIWSSAGVFVFGTVLKIDANKKLKRKKRR